jgi:hypothetical protein
VDKLFLDGVISQTFIINRLGSVGDFSAVPLLFGFVFSAVCVFMAIIKRSQRI